MTVHRSVDKQAITQVLNHPQVFHSLTDDRSPFFYEATVAPHIIYLMDETQHGVIRIDPVNGITCSAHIATMPEMRGTAVDFVKDALDWGFRYTHYLKVMALIPVFNKNAMSLATRSGFEREGILKKSFLKNWKLHDQIIFGLCKKGERIWHL